MQRVVQTIKSAENAERKGAPENFDHKQHLFQSVLRSFSQVMLADYKQYQKTLSETADMLASPPAPTDVGDRTLNPTPYSENTLPVAHRHGTQESGGAGLQEATPRLRGKAVRLRQTSRC